MTTRTGTQNAAILAHLRTSGSITPMDALRLYNCFRLAARIKDLRNDGHDVAMVLDGDGEKKWARYSLRRAAPAYAADGQGMLAL
jgi:hypothetical protein